MNANNSIAWPHSVLKQFKKLISYQRPTMRTPRHSSLGTRAQEQWEIPMRGVPLGLVAKAHPTSQSQTLSTSPESVQSWAGMWATSEHGSAWPLAGQSRAVDGWRPTLLQCCWGGWHRVPDMNSLGREPWGAVQGQQYLRVPTGFSQWRQT